ncbi:MAG: carboxypeptidase-like regulatory domain-containing protein [Flavobacteriales bacterium]
MLYYKKTFLLVLLCLTTFFAFAQLDKIEIHSKILNEKDSSTIGFVHIINLTTNHGVISDYNGEFNFTVNSTDTLKFSIIGYETKLIRGNEINGLIYLTPKNYELEEFTVIPYKDYEEFKEAFINLFIPDTTQKINPHIFMFDNDLFLYRGNTGFGIIIEGGISKLYDYLSKQGRSKIRYEELLARDRFKEFLSTKFNNLVVTNATGLNDKSEVEKFMIYCDFSDGFISKSNDYEIIKEIQDCFKEYKSNSK